MESGKDIFCLFYGGAALYNVSVGGPSLKRQHYSLPRNNRRQDERLGEREREREKRGPSSKVKKKSNNSEMYI